LSTTDAIHVYVRILRIEICERFLLLMRYFCFCFWTFRRNIVKWYCHGK